MSHIFISYSRKDTDYAHTLADSLQSMGLTVWIDARVDYGSQWPHEIQTQLDSCDAFILIMSPRSFASEWVQNELQRAKRKLKPVFPLLLEGDEPWLSVESTQYYDVRNRKLPDAEFYADLKRAIPAKQTSQTISQSQESSKKSEHVKNIQPRKKAVGLFAVLGSFVALFSVCLVIGILLFQRVADNRSPSPIPTGPDSVMAQPTSLEDITPPTALTATGPLPVQLPDGSEVMMIASRGERSRYTIVSAWREPFPPDKYLLRMRIQVWTDFLALNFWSDSFRLDVGDQSLVPVSLVNEVVDRDETLEGIVEFEIDPSLKEAVLEIRAGLYFNEPWAVKELRLIFP